MTFSKFLFIIPSSDKHDDVFLIYMEKNFTWSRHVATADKALSLGPSTEDWKSLGNISSLTAMDFSNKELLSEGRNK